VILCFSTRVAATSRVEGKHGLWEVTAAQGSARDALHRYKASSFE
jgi:hypothetical protein